MADTTSNNTIGGFGQQHDDQIYSRFDWFRPKKIQNLLKGRRRIRINPTSKQSPYEFVIPPNPRMWTDLQTLILHGRYRVWNRTLKAEPAAGENWSVINNINHSIWAQVGIKVNGYEFEDATTTTYPFKAYCNTLLNFNDVYKSTVLESTNGWAYDNAYPNGTSLTENVVTQETESKEIELRLDDDPNAPQPPTFKKYTMKRKKYTKNPDYNSGYAKRRKGIATGSWNEFHVILQHDLLTTEEIFEPNTRFEITLTKSSDDFCIMQPASNTNKYEIQLDNIHFTVEQIDATKTTNDYHQRKKASGKVPTAEIRRNIIKYYPVTNGGLRSLLVTNLVSA